MATHDDDLTRLRTALARISRGIDRTVSGDGMTRTQLGVLGTIARSESIGMGDLAETEGLNPTMLSRVVGKLEANGLVERSPDPQDRRAVRALITPDGLRLHHRLRAERTALLRERLAELDPADRSALLLAVPALTALAEVLQRRPATVGGPR